MEMKTRTAICVERLKAKFGETEKKPSRFFQKKFSAFSDALEMPESEKCFLQSHNFCSKQYKNMMKMNQVLLVDRNF